MLQIRHLIEPHIKWIVGKGNIDVYNDKWYSANTLQSNSIMKLNTFFNFDGSPNQESIRESLGQEILDEISSNEFIYQTVRTFVFGISLTLVPSL